jgi:TrmH family RNA methyltransferase
MKLEDVKKLQHKKYREELGHFLVEGEHLVLELQKAAMRDPRLRGSEVYVTSVNERWASPEWASPFPVHLISEANMAQIADTKTPQGIVAVVPMFPPPAPRPQEHAIYLYEVQDPGNLGTIFRTLAWFGNFRCLLSPGSVDPYNPKAVRASMGAIFHVPIELEVQAASLAQRFKRIACLDMQGEPLPSPRFRTFDCYVFGNEARGLPREQLAALNTEPFTISGSGDIESLNLASAVNMCVYELSRQP